MVLAILLLLAVAAGCQPRGSGAQGFTGDFQQLALPDGPARLQAYYDQSKAAPGLTVLQQDGTTYLLLTAGRAERPGMVVDVLAVKPPVRGSQEVSITAVVRPGTGTEGMYPYVLLELDGGAGLTYRARLTNGSEIPRELQGIPLADQ
jgi:hypothetical protein